MWFERTSEISKEHTLSSGEKLSLKKGPSDFGRLVRSREYSSSNFLLQRPHLFFNLYYIIIFRLNIFSVPFIYESLPYVLHPFFEPTLRRITSISTMLCYASFLTAIVHLSFDWDIKLFVKVGHTQVTMIFVSTLF